MRLSRKAVATRTVWSVELGAMHREEIRRLEWPGLVVLCDRTQVFDRWGATVHAREWLLWASPWFMFDAVCIWSLESFEMDGKNGNGSAAMVVVTTVISSTDQLVWS
jgi:hypothetical protein